MYMNHLEVAANLGNLAVELKIQIFQALPNFWSAVALRLTCREMNTIYLANETRIRDKYRDRIVAAVDDYYTFLISFYIDESALRRPPKTGWPTIHTEKSGRPDRDFVLDVARHLPYITPGDHGDNMRNLEYKCEPIDYSSSGGLVRCDNDDYLKEMLEGIGILPATITCQRIIQLTRGYESGGQSWYLDTMTGALIIEIIRCDYDGYDMAEHLERLKRNFRDLTYVPVLGEDLRGVKEEESTEYSHLEQVDLLAQEKDYGTDLDIQWVRHLYRKFGWPGPQYRKKEALQAIEDYRQRRNR